MTPTTTTTTPPPHQKTMTDQFYGWQAGGNCHWPLRTGIFMGITQWMGRTQMVQPRPARATNNEHKEATKSAAEKKGGKREIEVAITVSCAVCRRVWMAPCINHYWFVPFSFDEHTMNCKSKNAGACAHIGAWWNACEACDEFRRCWYCECKELLLCHSIQFFLSKQFGWLCFLRFLILAIRHVVDARLAGGPKIADFMEKTTATDGIDWCIIIRWTGRYNLWSFIYYVSRTHTSSSTGLEDTEPPQSGHGSAMTEITTAAFAKYPMKPYSHTHSHVISSAFVLPPSSSCLCQDIATLTPIERSHFCSIHSLHFCCYCCCCRWWLTIVLLSLAFEIDVNCESNVSRWHTTEEEHHYNNSRNGNLMINATDVSVLRVQSQFELDPHRMLQMKVSSCRQSDDERARNEKFNCDWAALSTIRRMDGWMNVCVFYFRRGGGGTQPGQHQP